MDAPANRDDFSLADGHDYALERNHPAACRLNLQHYLWKDTLGFSIHPAIPLAATSTIADIATGTGMWLMDVARHHPHAQLDGFDIDLTQAPPRGWMPANTTLNHWNMLEPVPEELVAKYDIVHVRLLVLVIESGDPRAILSKLCSMLKPGGWLQWDDIDCLAMEIKTVDPGVKAPALEKLREKAYADGRQDWVRALPDLAKAEGFEEARSELFGERIDLARAFGEQHLAAMEEFGARLLGMGQEQAGKEILRLVREGYRGSLGGAAFCIPRAICVARKGG